MDKVVKKPFPETRNGDSNQRYAYGSAMVRVPVSVPVKIDPTLSPPESFAAIARAMCQSVMDDTNNVPIELVISLPGEER